jgi:hypothetical protein
MRLKSCPYLFVQELPELGLAAFQHEAGTSALGGEFFPVKIGGGWLLDSGPRSGLNKNLKKGSSEKSVGFLKGWGKNEGMKDTELFSQMLGVVAPW